jgi:N-acetylmuramoyl-L-alanine amidase
MHWLAAGLVGSTLCLVAPVWAGELSSWRFDPSSNQLEFNTETGVQPRAQLETGPTRLVIDLPGTTWKRSQVLEALSGGSFQNLRVSQYDENTARIEVELAPGYSIDPEQIQFRGISPTQWTVQLPQPKLEDGGTTGGIGGTTSGTTVTQAPATQAPTPETSSRPTFSSAATRSAQPATPVSQTTTPPAVRRAERRAAESRIAEQQPTAPSEDKPEDNSMTQVDAVRMTGEGLLVQTRGATPDMKIEPGDNDSRFISLTIRNAQLANSELDNQRIPVDQFGVRNVEVEQRSRDRVRIKFQVTRESGEWRATNISGGIAVQPSSRRVVPTTAAAAAPRAARVSQVSSATPTAQTATGEEPATIEGIKFNDTNSQLLIESDRTVNATGQWRSGLYEVTLSPARLGSGVDVPRVPSDSTLLRARAYQADEQTVVISMHPRAGTLFSGLTMVDSNVVALGIGRSPTTSTASELRLPNTRPQSPGRDPNSSAPLPSIQNGRTLVVIDPGHGGSDPGAVGIGNIHEADVVLEIAQQVASILEQQGVQATLTRTSDVDVELEPRVAMAEQVNASLFVSIHANAIDMSRPDVNGTSTYYFSSGEDLAQTVQNAIVGIGMPDRGIHSARFYVLRKTSMPAILVETAFVTGGEDAKKLADSNWRSQMATAIANGVLQYLQGRSQ